ncbi:MMPL family transporter [Streptomyces sp. NBC_00663]|uniref:MMPL family transporter n=1 Tax=Streptomyces sp. NBC_00663 TaxID=2975801 RepID=UPI003FCCE39E
MASTIPARDHHDEGVRSRTGGAAGYTPVPTVLPGNFVGLTVGIAPAGLPVVGSPVLTKTGPAAAGVVVIAVLSALTPVPALLGKAAWWMPGAGPVASVGVEGGSLTREGPTVVGAAERPTARI